MGIAFSIVGVSALIGTPIEGALLHLRPAGYEWYRALIFCGVSASLTQGETNIFELTMAKGPGLVRRFWYDTIPIYVPSAPPQLAAKTSVIDGALRMNLK